MRISAAKFVRVLAGCGAAATLACATPGAQLQPSEAVSAELARALERSSGEPTSVADLRIELAFGPGADFDLFVTDPRLETVYYGNPTAHSGGRLERDVRCDSPEPHIETVRYTRALPGRYRVSVDFAKRCADWGGPATYVVRFGSASASQSIARASRPGHFEPIVVEFDWPLAAAASSSK